MIWTLNSRPRAPKETRPIPNYVYDLPAFHRRYKFLVKNAGLGSMDPTERLAMNKEIIRDAALYARDDALSEPNLSAHSLASTVASISRAVYSNDRASAHLLISQSPIASHRSERNLDRRPSKVLGDL